MSSFFELFNQLVFIRNRGTLGILTSALLLNVGLVRAPLKIGSVLSTGMGYLSGLQLMVFQVFMGGNQSKAVVLLPKTLILR